METKYFYMDIETKVGCCGQCLMASILVMYEYHGSSITHGYFSEIIWIMFTVMEG